MRPLVVVASRVRPLVARAVLALAAAPVVAAAGCATPPDAPEKASALRARDYVPLAVGNRWEYRVVQPGGPSGTAGAPQGEGPAETIEIVAKDEKGYFEDTKGRKLAPRTDGVFDGERFLLQEPLEAGHEWIAVPKNQPDAVEKYRIVNVGTLARVPAGTFENCVEVELTTVVRHQTTNQKATVTMTSVYAPGVGLIKSFGTFAPEGGQGFTTPSMELVSFDVKRAAEGG